MSMKIKVQMDEIDKITAIRDEAEKLLDQAMWKIDLIQQILHSAELQINVQHTDAQSDVVNVKSDI